MSDKQTRCPNCATIYNVSVMQLTAAEGMVCCPKCSAEFNALLHLYYPEPVKSESDQHLMVQSMVDSSPVEFEEPKSELHVLDIFERKVSQSNITLKTYLNNLNTFNYDPVTHFPVLNLSSTYISPGQAKAKSWFYICLWSIGNSFLVGLLFFQILWFNPHLLDRSPVLNHVFLGVCQAFSCVTMDERYTYIEFKKVKLRPTVNNRVVIQGQIVNNYPDGLQLPLIQVTLFKDSKKVYTQTLSPEDYLVESLSGIRRIPQNSPFNFKMSLNSINSSFDDYKLEVIRP